MQTLKNNKLKLVAPVFSADNVQVKNGIVAKRTTEQAKWN